MGDDTDRSMLDGVERWVGDSGFGLELHAAHAFMAAGFRVEQSSFFEDSESGDAREIDVVADDPELDGSFGALEVLFVVECKASKKGPWVMFTSSGSATLGNRFMNFGVLSDGAFDAIGDHVDQMISRVSWFPKKDDRVAYAFRQAHSKDGADPAFAASVAVVKACEASLLRAANDPPSAVVAFPVIVVDSPLVVCRLDSHGAIALEEAEEFEYVFHGLRNRRIAPCIRVVTRDRAVGFASEARAVARQIGDVLSEWTEGYKRDMRASVRATDSRT